MDEPKRVELSGLARSVIKLRFMQRLPSVRTGYGFKAIRDLRPSGEQ